MLPSTKDEQDDVRHYYLSQSPGAEVLFLQKMYSEVIVGHRHDVWDVHASDGRWWVITNPTNLYSQEQFPNLDLAVTFHMGLCLRIPRTDEQRRRDPDVRPFRPVITRLREIADALAQAQNVSDYQAIGVRCREALLAFISAFQDMTEAEEEERPQRANFRAWSEIICNETLPGSSHKERRHLFKTMLAEAWTFANWLTHAQSATWHDAEAAQSTTELILSHSMSLIQRLLKSVPEECPECGSPNLSPEEGYLDEIPEVLWERPACGNCGWTGTPVAVAARDVADNEPLISREGGSDGCVTPTVPLMKIKKPVDRETQDDRPLSSE